jgi:hypothetical protein
MGCTSSTPGDPEAEKRNKEVEKQIKEVCQQF